MKGYISNHILYVFPQEAAEIPYVDASVEAIAIQPELLDAFKKANPTYADIMFSYNYQTITVNPKPFAGHTNDDIVVPVKPSPELVWSAETATVTIGADDNVFPTLTNSHSVTVTYTSSDTTKATINESTGVITLVDAGNTTISAVFAGDDTYAAQTVTYTLTVEPSVEPTAEPTAEPTPEPVSAGIEWDNYGNAVIVTIGADDNVYPSLVNPNNVSPIVYSSDTESVATINQLGEVTLVSAGTANIGALFEGDSTYMRSATAYTLTVNAAQQ